MKLLLINHTKEKMPRAFLTSWLNRVEKKLKPKHKFGKRREMVIVFVSKAEMKRMNGHYRGKNSVTDILSFAPAEESSLGELVICPQVVKSQSARTGLSPREELAYMVLHGVLHLLGYDHEGSERQARRMFALQDRVFASLR